MRICMCVVILYIVLCIRNYIITKNERDISSGRRKNSSQQNQIEIEFDDVNSNDLTFDIENVLQICSYLHAVGDSNVKDEIRAKTHLNVSRLFNKHWEDTDRIEQFTSFPPNMKPIPVLCKEIASVFKLNGFITRSETRTFLAEQLHELSNEEQKEWLNNITTHIQSQGLPTPNVEIKHIELAIKENCNAGLEDSETIFSTISAFDVPKYKYDIERKKYFLQDEKRNLLPAAAKRSEFLIDRYTMLWQRTCRHELFSASIPGTSSQVKKFNLRKIESLLANTSVSEEVVLGMLAQLKENKFYIEDPTGSLPVDLSNVQYHSGFFCEGCFVLIEGNYNDGVMKASGMGFPPIESAASSRAYFGSLNTWGGRSKILLKNSTRLTEIEQTNTDATIVFLADCWLDDPMVLQKLQTLFVGYNDMPPVAIVLMGPFIRNLSNPLQLKAKLQLLGEMISNNCPILKKHTDLILIPAIDDPIAPVILPRVGLPESLCAGLKRLVPRTILATNPCRLQYCTQQIVVCRADLVTKLCRNTINFPDNGKLEDHFARTLMCQGTLAPLSQGIMPIYWDMDSSLALYPLPDLIVIGDPSKPFETEHQGCTVVNTGSFPKSKFTFKVYVPSTKIIEDSQIPDED